MKDRVFETVVGFIVLIFAVGFFIYSYNRSDWKDMQGYNITAKFENIDGISKGSFVKISGVKVGLVSDICVDKESYSAKVTMVIDGNIKLPRDTEANVTSEGILGGKYISLSPGYETEMLNENDEISQTSSSQSLETLISKFLLMPKDPSKNEKGSDEDKPSLVEAPQSNDATVPVEIKVESNKEESL